MVLWVWGLFAFFFKLNLFIHSLYNPISVLPLLQDPWSCFLRNVNLFPKAKLPLIMVLFWRCLLLLRYFHFITIKCSIVILKSIALYNLKKNYLFHKNRVFILFIDSLWNLYNAPQSHFSSHPLISVLCLCNLSPQIQNKTNHTK